VDAPMCRQEHDANTLCRWHMARLLYSRLPCPVGLAWIHVQHVLTASGRVRQ
jgi:hypothetical protein